MGIRRAIVVHGTADDFSTLTAAVPSTKSLSWFLCYRTSSYLDISAAVDVHDIAYIYAVATVVVHDIANIYAVATVVALHDIANIYAVSAAPDIHNIASNK